MGILRVNQVSGDETQLSTLGIGTTTPVTGSVFFDGSGDYLTLASSGDFAYGTGDFTWEGWFYVQDISSGRYIIDHGSNGGTIEVSSASGRVTYYNSTTFTSSVLYTTGFGIVALNAWNHFAAVRRSGTTSLYLNGNLTASASDSHNYGAQVLNIGRYGGGGYEFYGYISNLRILKGTALYTANFTPPTRILEPIQDTVLLCCNNPDSAAAVSLAGIGTSKTITVNGNAVASTFNPALVRNFTSGTQFSGVAKFDTQGYFVPPSGTTTQRNGGRGLFAGGYASGFQTVIDYISIQSLGIAQDFGDLTIARETNDEGFSSSTRGFFAGGATPTNTNVIDFVTISSTSNAIDFGDLLSATYGCAGVSNSTRGLMMGGITPTVINVIQYITMSSIGNTQDFGDLTGNFYGSAGFQSPTRGVCAGGATPVVDNTIQYVTIASLGNAQDFGDATFSKGQLAGASNSTRGIFAGGTNENTINYVTIATTGNASDFGDLITGRREVGACSTPTRWVIGGGYNDAGGLRLNSIEYVTIASTGNAQDFGDLSVGRSGTSACSDSHGGIS